MNKIGIWGWFGFRNCGDDLLLINTINEIRSCLSDDCSITVFGENHNIKQLAPLDFVNTKKRSAATFIKYAFKADTIIIGPGGIFPSTNSKKLIFYLLITLIMKIRHKRIGYIGIGIGIGMFQSKHDILLLNLISKYADIFVSRSPNYLKFSPELNTDRIILSSDMIFSDLKVHSANHNSNSKSVVIALANIFKSNTDEYKEKFISEFIFFVKHILSKSYTIKLVSFTNESDMEINNIIANQFDPSLVTSIPFCENPYDTCELLKDADICIGMRFHALVIALSCGIPCLSISYSDKNEDVMKRFGLLDYSMRFGISKKEYFNEEIMISSDELILKFDNIVLQYDKLKKIILEKQKNMYLLSLINREKLCQLLEKKDL